MTNRYESPLSSRYASEYMLGLFSSDTRYQTWRKLWVALAKAEMSLGLPITQAQVDELSAHITDIDYECVSQRDGKSKSHFSLCEFNPKLAPGLISGIGGKESEHIFGRIS